MSVLFFSSESHKLFSIRQWVNNIWYYCSKVWGILFMLKTRESHIPELKRMNQILIQHFPGWSHHFNQTIVWTSRAQTTSDVTESSGPPNHPWVFSYCSVDHLKQHFFFNFESSFCQNPACVGKRRVELFILQDPHHLSSKRTSTFFLRSSDRD